MTLRRSCSRLRAGRLAGWVFAGLGGGMVLGVRGFLFSCEHLGLPASWARRFSRHGRRRGRLGFAARSSGAWDLGRIEKWSGLAPALRQEPGVGPGDGHDLCPRSLPRLGHQPCCGAPPALEPAP